MKENKNNELQADALESVAGGGPAADKRAEIAAVAKMKEAAYKNWLKKAEAAEAGKCSTEEVMAASDEYVELETLYVNANRDLIAIIKKYGDK